jgi:hypothetical protein
MASPSHFHFFAITQVGPGETEVKRIRTSQQLQTELADFFNGQAEKFLHPDLERIHFEGTYQVDDSEVFVIEDFKIAEIFKTASLYPSQYESIVLDKTNPPTIKAIFAASHDYTSDSATIYFQSFRKTQLILKGFTLSFHSKNTFRKMKDAGLTLDEKLAAVFQDGQLLFRSYFVVNSFLDVQEYFKEATDEEIVQVVNHPILLAEDEEQLTSISDSWMRRRFAALQASGILDQITPRKTANKARKYDVEIVVTKKKNGKDAIVFPYDKKKAKKLLTFLNEGFYQGELTDRLYQTNSQRVLPKPGGATS